MAVKLATGTAMNEGVTVFLQDGALKTRCGISPRGEWLIQINPCEYPCIQG